MLASSAAFGRTTTYNSAESDIKMFSGALETFCLEHGRYPNQSEGLMALVTRPADVAESKWQPFLHNCAGLIRGVTITCIAFLASTIRARLTSFPWEKMECPKAMALIPTTSTVGMLPGLGRDITQASSHLGGSLYGLLDVSDWPGLHYSHGVAEALQNKQYMMHPHSSRKPPSVAGDEAAREYAPS